MHCKIPCQGHKRESDFVSISVAYLYDPHYSDPWTEASGTGQRLAMIAGTLKYSTDGWLEDRQRGASIGRSFDSC